MLIDVTVHKSDGVHENLVADHSPTVIQLCGCCEEAITQWWVDEIERGRGGSDGFRDIGPFEFTRPLTNDIRRPPVLMHWVRGVFWVRLKYEIYHRLAREIRLALDPFKTKREDGRLMNTKVGAWPVA